MESILSAREIDQLVAWGGKTGPESLGSVQTFLDRYVALRDGTDPGRADQREADRAAASTLESRHIVTPAQPTPEPAPQPPAMHA